MAETRQIKLKRKVDTDSSASGSSRQKFTFAIVVLLIGLCFIAGVRYFAARKKNADLQLTADMSSAGLYLKLSMAKTSYDPGEPIDVQLFVQNISEQEIILEFENSCKFDFIVQSEMELAFAQIPTNIWQFSSDPAHLPDPKPDKVKIAPQGKVTFKARWEQQNYKGERVKPGRYAITGFLKAKNRSDRLQLRGETKN